MTDHLTQLYEPLSADELALLLHDAELLASREHDGFKLSLGEWETAVLRAAYELRERRDAD